MLDCLSAGLLNDTYIKVDRPLYRVIRAQYVALCRKLSWVLRFIQVLEENIYIAVDRTLH